MKKLILFTFVMFALTSAVAQEFPSAYDAHVNDFAGFFTEEEESYMRGILQGLESETTAEVVVVTVQNTEPWTPQEYRTKLFEEWQIGKADKDNGLLILYAVDEKRIEVETGYGLEGILPDSKLGRLLDKNYVPLRDQGRANEGVIAFTEIAANEIYLNKEEVISGRNEQFDYVALFIVLFFLFVVIWTFYRIAKSSGSGGRSSGWGYVPIGGFGGGSSGGFGGFGGGASGGGGVGR